MPPSSPTAGRRSWPRLLLVGVALVAVAHLLDDAAWRGLRDARVNERDWGRMLRSIGYLPVWIVLALAYWLHARGTAHVDGAHAGRRAGYLLAAPVLGGLVAELGKLLVRRLRPDETVFGYTFRAWSDAPWSNRGFGMPSSHVMVAFAGAAALAHLFPKARAVGYVLAAGCALTRVLTVQHFLSDTVTAALLGWLVAALLAPRMLRAPQS